MAKEHAEVCTEGDRLNRIERKIDNLGEALIAIARVDERVAAVEERVSEIYSLIAEHEDRVRDLEGFAIENNQVIKNIIKLVWIIVTAIIGHLSFIIFMGA